MNTHAEFYAIDTITAIEPQKSCICWFARLLVASLGSWALVVGAARLVVSLV
jgi:hypothetical protein